MNALAALGAKTPPHEPVRLARVIVTRAGFRLQVRAARATWWDAVRNWLADRWNQILDAFAHHVHVGAKASVAIGDVLIAVAVLLVIGVGVRLLSNAARETASAARAHATALSPQLGADDLYRTALSQAAAGAYAPAVSLLFRSALASLETLGALRADPARTVNESRSDVRARLPQHAQAFDVLARAFTEAAYAETRITHEQWTAALAAFRTLGGERRAA